MEKGTNELIHFLALTGLSFPFASIRHFDVLPASVGTIEFGGNLEANKQVYDCITNIKE